MAHYEIAFTTEGKLVIEADTPAEAEELADEALRDFDTTMLDTIIIEDVELQTPEEQR